jgi:hypothetical protein
MSRSRAFALVTTLAVMLSTMGGAAFNSTAASADPAKPHSPKVQPHKPQPKPKPKPPPHKPQPPKPQPGHGHSGGGHSGHGQYPPPPPSLVVNHGVVKKGNNVRASGRKFQARERASLVVSLKQNGASRYRVVRNTTVYTDGSGNFDSSVPTSQAGSITITATGRSSRKSATASLIVLDSHKPAPPRRMKRAAFNGADTSAAAPKAENGNIDGLAIAGLAVMVMAGGALVTQRTVRRRRKAADTTA